MSVQASKNNNTAPFILLAMWGSRDDKATLLQDGGRATDLAPYTLMAQIAATGKWVPFTDETAVTGAGLPTGIYVGDAIAAADIVAGDVTDLAIVKHGVKFDEDQLVIENSKTLATVLGATTVNARTVRSELVSRSLIPATTQDNSAFENA